MGIPLRIDRVEGIVGLAMDGQALVPVDLSLTGPVPAGTWVLSFLGAAREVIGSEEAARILAALDGLRAVMAGGTVGDAFADLEASGPRLPAHLQAALAAGRTTG
ncbi:HypC/HybG/HupF family hydrogenase formation chaperone [Tropicimonas sp. IMCC34043]|uniref:HypC/HybG/HupF family hydrogenase formation chaperone n=1 Tax=Tropicimonas sp. IMCC34043 TaxID=2248760 RepID=UPI0035154A0D